MNENIVWETCTIPNPHWVRLETTGYTQRWAIYRLGDALKPKASLFKNDGDYISGIHEKILTFFFIPIEPTSPTSKAAGKR